MTAPFHSQRVPRRPRILLVDDDQAVLSGLQGMLVTAEPTWGVRSARDGAEALAIVRDEAARSSRLAALVAALGRSG